MAERLLVIDDEPANLRLYRAVIEKRFPGAIVRAESGGVPGLAAVKEFRPDLVLLDARMPDMDGFEVCRNIKTDPLTARVPVLMVSGAYIQTHHRISGFEGGADGYVCKPFKSQDLADQIKVLLDGGGTGKKAYRIMVVDASRTSRHVILSEVKRNPYVEVAAFENADAAMAALDAVDPDMVIADADAGALSGFELGKRIRGVVGHEDTRIVLLDRQAGQAGVEGAGLPEGFEWLPKPFAPSALLDCVGRMVSKRREVLSRMILIADRNPHVRGVIREHLGGMRVEISEARSVAEAEHAVTSKPIALVVLGAQLDGGSGAEWCGALRQRPECRWMPILGVSDNGTSAAAFIEAGADDCVSDGLGRSELRLRVANLLKRVALADELNTALQRERSLNEHRNRLLGIAAHDIRSPVSAIAHYAELLLASPLDDVDAIRAKLDGILSTARHALGIVNSVLDVKSIQSGVVEFQAKPFRLDELLQERLAFMNEMGRAKRIAGRWQRRGDDSGSAWIRGDPQRLAQVADNLMGNAVKYCPEGSSYTVSLCREVEGWLVDVEDNGPGIPRDEVLGLFEEFGRTSVRATNGEKSTGLGLAIVKKLVELHGGTVWMDSRVGKGTKVSFVLPACDPDEKSGRK